MMRKLKLLGIIAVVAVFGFSMASCGGGCHYTEAPCFITTNDIGVPASWSDITCGWNNADCAPVRVMNAAPADRAPNTTTNCNC